MSYSPLRGVYNTALLSIILLDLRGQFKGGERDGKEKERKGRGKTPLSRKKFWLRL